jgi:hypothetical protein
MALSEPSSLLKTTGTLEADSLGKHLQVGALSVEFDNGNLRYIRLHGVEVLRAVSFLVRDENWGTYAATLRNLSIEQDEQYFKISYAATCSRADQSIDYEASIEGRADGSLTFRGKAIPRTDFLTARTGFVVLHPLTGVVGQALKVEHVDGTVTQSEFPQQVNPDCPFRDVRALSHQVFPGVWARCEMQGDAFEMEDHRNWTDASFKTYVRPLARPWPYVLPAGVTVEQSVKLAISGQLPKAQTSSASRSIELTVGLASQTLVPPIGIGMPAEEVDAALAKPALMRLLSPQFLVCHFDPRQHHNTALLGKYQQLASELRAEVMLEVVVQSLTDFASELQGVAQMAKAAGLQVDMLAVCPVGHLKSVLPGGTYPPAPELADLYQAARSAFPYAQLGGGMFSFFTELNRKRPPAVGLDFVTNATSPIVHAADDRSVMETLEALPWQIETAKHFTGGKPHHVGPSGIGARDNPHGATFSPNPHNARVCLSKMDPRQRGLFSAAWTLGYISTLVQAGVDRISMAAPTGPLGMIYTHQADFKQPWFDDLPNKHSQQAVFPVFHTMVSLHCASGHPLLKVSCSDATRVSSLGWSDSKGKTLLIANMSAQTADVHVKGLSALTSFGMLDESHFTHATTDANAFRQASQWLPKNHTLSLGAYAVACLYQPHG